MDERPVDTTYGREHEAGFLAELVKDGSVKEISYFVETLQYQISITVTAEYWRKIGRPASSPLPDDVKVRTFLAYLQEAEKLGVEKVSWVDHLASFLTDNYFGVLLNKLRPNKNSYINYGLRQAGR